MRLTWNEILELIWFIVLICGVLVCFFGPVDRREPQEPPFLEEEIVVPQETEAIEIVQPPPVHESRPRADAMESVTEPAPPPVNPTPIRILRGVVHSPETVRRSAERWENQRQPHVEFHASIANYPTIPFAQLHTTDEDVPLAVQVEPPSPPEETIEARHLRMLAEVEREQRKTKQRLRELQRHFERLQSREARRKFERMEGGNRMDMIQVHYYSDDEDDDSWHQDAFNEISDIVPVDD